MENIEIRCKGFVLIRDVKKMPENDLFELDTTCMGAMTSKEFQDFLTELNETADKIRGYNTL